MCCQTGFNDTKLVTREEPFLRDGCPRDDGRSGMRAGGCSCSGCDVGVGSDGKRTRRGVDIGDVANIDGLQSVSATIGRVVMRFLTKFCGRYSRSGNDREGERN